MSMTRRDALIALAGGAAAAALPGIPFAMEDGLTVIRGETFVLDEPMFFRGARNLLIEHCHFVAGPDLGGSAMLMFDEKCGEIEIRNVTFDMTKARNSTGLYVG